MHDYLFIIPITIGGILGVMSPGPSFLFVAQTTLNKSREHGIATSLGLGTGAAIFTLLSYLGLFVVLETAPFLYDVLKFIGGLYLLYLAYKIWFSATDESPKTDQAQTLHSTTKNKSNDYIKSYFLGLLIQLSNPKTAITIGSVIMAFLPHEVPPYSFLILTVLTFITDCGWYCIVSIALSTSKAQAFYNRFKQTINKLAGGIIGLFGAKLTFNL